MRPSLTAVQVHNAAAVTYSIRPRLTDLSTLWFYVATMISEELS